MTVNRNGRVAGLVLLMAWAVPTSAQYIDGAPPPLLQAPYGGEAPGDALARNVRILAQTPRDYRALVGAGRAALGTGDAEAAIGFFGRASEISPNAAAPHAGLGAALAEIGEASRALNEFTRAEKLGALPASFAADRGLARDLLGQQALAQADYRLALAGADSAEVRRRLALSLAISGDSVGANIALAPLLRNSDVPTDRVRAFVLALGGNADAADRALDQSVPGMARSLDPFFRRLSGLSPAQKAAAVHLGIFPGSGSSATLVANVFPARPMTPLPNRAGPNWTPPASRFPALPVKREHSSITDRLAGIDELLRRPSQAAVTALPPPPPPPIAPPPPASTAVLPSPKRDWVQLASGTSETALGQQFTRIVERKPDLFDGIRPFVSLFGDRTKLLIGPFKNSEQSEIFLESLADARIEGFTWTSPEGQLVRKLATP